MRVEPLRDAAGMIVGCLGLGVDVTERERAAAALRDSEARFRAIFEHAAIGIGLSDLDRRPLMVNPALARFTGYDGVKEMHRPIPQTTHPDDLVQDRALYAELVAGRRDSYQLEKRYRRKDGVAAWGRLTTSLVRDASGAPQYAIGMVEDITARVLTGAALRERESRYRAVMGQAAEGIFLFEAESKRIVEANPAFLRLLGYVEGELARLTLYDLVAHDPASIDANAARIAVEGHNAIGDRRYRRKDGAIVIVEVSATVLEPSPSPVFCVVVRDVTERRATEAALATSEAALRTREAQLRGITENIPLIFFALDAAGVVLAAAGSGLDTLGLTPEQVAGRAVFATDNTAELIGYARRALDGEALTATVPIRDRLFETHYAPLREAGRIVGVSGVALDITAQARAQAELRRRDAGLTPRERELLPLLSRQGLTYRQIGVLLYIKESTVRTYVEQIAEKLGVATTRKAVVAAARERGLIDAP